MYVDKGDRVILTETDQPQLRPYIGKEWAVQAVVLEFHPASAVIKRNNLEASVFIRHLEVMPPSDSCFQHGDSVQICKPYSKSNAYSYHAHLLGKIGTVRGFDSRYSFYLVKCNDGTSGWFPVFSLRPLDYKGEHFYYPYEEVLYKGEKKLITKIKQTKFKWGQLLFIEGEWIHSSDVKALTQ